MYKGIISMLKCPVCGSEIELLYGTELGEEIIEGKLICSNAHHWHIHHGVINFGSQEQSFANNWSENYKKQNFEELDNEIWSSIPDNLKKLYIDAKRDTIENINKRSPSNLVDIATGRGMLLLDMVKEVNGEVHIICIDLSFEVLRFDRIKVKRINPNIKVSYIACDATNIPLKSSSVDMCTSFFGVANMMNSTIKGISEANRILKPSERFLNTSILIKEESRGYETLKDYLQELDMNECANFVIEEGFKASHINGGFSDVHIKNIGNSIGQRNEHDLLPFQGEWFEIVTAYCKR